MIQKINNTGGTVPKGWLAPTYLSIHQFIKGTLNNLHIILLGDPEVSGFTSPIKMGEKTRKKSKVKNTFDSNINRVGFMLIIITIGDKIKFITVEQTFLSVQ